MLRGIGSGGSSSFTESLVLRYIPPSTYSKLLFISSKKMTIRRTLDVLQSRQSFPPGRRPDSLGKLSSKSNDGLSSPDVNHGSRSTDFAQCERRQASPGRMSGGSRGRSPKSKPDEYPFDICRPENAGLVKLKKPLLLLNRERKKELGQREVIPQIQRLRSGMVLLKNFIGLTTQVHSSPFCCLINQIRVNDSYRTIIRPAMLYGAEY
ncbi:alkylated DNA repair protein [Apostasia shenzhenica]|uniref:Alkylated DNA repair protein n=1 Tax=Apostasia shenzhenica TaxID=1088818 RepID=A0A2I0BH70_9ASPA|nr:alkylated DNA repair protein [Apostasia shenzhenica]